MMPVPLWEPCRSVAFGQIVLAEGFLKQTTVDLAERDGQRLLLILVFHQRADVLQQTLIELGEIGIDLAGTLGRENGQSVLGVGSVPNAIVIISKSSDKPKASFPKSLV